MRGLSRLVCMLFAGVTGCGDDMSTAMPDAGTTFAPSSAFANRCATPRSGVDPISGSRYRDVQGTIDEEKGFLRSWTHELYLWYSEVPDPAPGGFATPIDYFNVLKTSATTASGNPKDRFHFTIPTSAWEAEEQSGTSAGYGVEWVVVAKTAPRQVVAAFAVPGTPAAMAGVNRGAQVVSVDGVDLVNGSDTATLNAGLFPTMPNETHSFGILDLGASQPRTVMLTSAAIEVPPVGNVQVLTTPGGPVGYLHFNAHVATAEAALIAAMNRLKSAAVTDLILDIRYNSGGYLAIASELAFMIAGPTASAGKTFERPLYNDHYSTRDPFTGSAIMPMLFFDKTVLDGLNHPLPHLDLPRVYVLTGAATCSASESVINSLRGIHVQVIQIGKGTCGKPYAFLPQDNCGTTYFSIEFQGVNDVGFGDYGDGFLPGGSGPAGLPGCPVADDFAHSLGDPAEARLAAALGHLANGTCPPASVLPVTDGEMVKSPFLTNRIFFRR